MILSDEELQSACTFLVRLGIDFAVKWVGGLPTLESDAGCPAILQLRGVIPKEWAHRDLCGCGAVKRIRANVCVGCHKAAKTVQRGPRKNDGPLLYSEQDEALFRAYHWHQSVDGYYYRVSKAEGGLHRKFFHREMFGHIPDGLHVDHINRVRSDCRRENLRIVTPRENCQNREAPLGASGVRGVHRLAKGERIRWRAYFPEEGLYPSFKTVEEASAFKAEHGARCAQQ